MKVWCLFLTHSDECTYWCTRLHKLFATQHAAEVEKTRLELLHLEFKEYRGGLDYYERVKKLDKSDQDTLDGDLDVEEWEVNQ